jgi:galactokinase
MKQIHNIKLSVEQIRFLRSKLEEILCRESRNLVTFAMINSIMKATAVEEDLDFIQMIEKVQDVLNSCRDMEYSHAKVTSEQVDIIICAALNKLEAAKRSHNKRKQSGESC